MGVSRINRSSNVKLQPKVYRGTLNSKRRSSVDRTRTFELGRWARPCDYDGLTRDVAALTRRESGFCKVNSTMVRETVAASSEFVGLTSRFTSGWPWPEKSWGLEPMYGRDGWCAGCGVPKHMQTGSMVLQATKFPTSDFWMPNWQFDALCVRAAAADAVLAQFRVRTLPVRTPRSPATGVRQLLAATATGPWFDEAALAERVKARHGEAGRTCGLCHIWRWFPLTTKHLPPATLGDETIASDVVASCEWFGDGMRAMHELRFRRPLAEALVSLNPRVWSIVEPVVGS